MKRAALLATVVAALGGCSPSNEISGFEAFRRMSDTEAHLPVEVREVNEVVESGHPVLTMGRRIQKGPVRWRYDVLAGDRMNPRLGMASRGRWDDYAWSYRPEHRLLEISRVPPDNLGPGNQMDLLMRNYVITRQGLDQVSGRRAYRVDVRPRRPGRPTQRVWIDAQSFVRLRLEQWNADGRLVSVTQTVDLPKRITLNDKAIAGPLGNGVSSLRPPSANANGTQAPRRPAATSFVPARIGYLPAGFAVVRAYFVSSPVRDGGTLHWYLTDGGAGIVVMQTRQNLDALGNLRAAGDVRGPFAVAGHDGYHFWARGNVSRSELVRIVAGMSVRPISEAR